ncbi:MAG: hydroxymethylglutaryl-CoA lyase [Rhodothermales bacterium]|nr:hydroxymethylglutaryl-CoA lyase [Rhodothermales bacterium]
MPLPQAQYPDSVSLCEVGPRDGFQFEDVPIPTDLKIKIIHELIRAGLPRIQAMSFVHPKWVPQMADAEAIAQEFANIRSCTISALVLNRKGLERAVAANVSTVDISIATNEHHSRDNANMTVHEGVEMARGLIRDALEAHLSVQIGLQTVWGYASPDDANTKLIDNLVAEFSEMNVESISLADSTGLASPLSIQTRLVDLLAAAGQTPIVLHLHDTRGLGLANVTAALLAGVTRYDTSLGGMGGCPFIPGATGNIATEDVIHLCKSLDIETGIDSSLVAKCSREMVEHRGAPLPGKLYGLL